MRRRLRTWLPVLLVPTLLAVSVSRCGKDSDKDKDKGGDGGSDSSDGGGGVVPADWDGVSDYSSSAFEVIEE